MRQTRVQGRFTTTYVRIYSTRLLLHGRGYVREEGQPWNSKQKLEVWIGPTTSLQWFSAQVCRVMRAARTMDLTVVTVDPVDEHYVANVAQPCGADGF